MKRQLVGFVARRVTRFPIRTTTMYLGKDFAGQGILRELSPEGCHMLGNYPVTLGDVLSLRISFPTPLTPIWIKDARVKWVDGMEFGVAFTMLDESAAEHLENLLR